MHVYICVYTHKHGVDVAAYKTEEAALKAAWQLANERVDDSWEDEDKEKFKAIDNAQDAINFFHEIERDISYGEEFEITESPVFE
jgi:hypothetical protein